MSRFPDAHEYDHPENVATEKSGECHVRGDPHESTMR